MEGCNWILLLEAGHHANLWHVLQILAADPNSLELLCELLLPHVRSYMLEDDQQLPPVQLQRCTNTIQVIRRACCTD